jgi:hypothetical protein
MGGMSMSIRLNLNDLMEANLLHPNRIRRRAALPHRRPENWIARKEPAQPLHKYWQKKKNGAE